MTLPWMSNRSAGSAARHGTHAMPAKAAHIARRIIATPASRRFRRTVIRQGAPGSDQPNGGSGRRSVLFAQLSAVVNDAPTNNGAQYLSAGNPIRRDGCNVPVEDDEVRKLSNLE